MDHKATLRDSIQREFRERIVFSAKDERELMINVLSDKVHKFLALDVKDSNKYSQEVSEVIDDSVAYIHDWNPNKASNAFLSLMRYILNILDQPYKKTFHTLKIYSGYYFLKVHQHLKDADRILLLVGYRMEDNNTLQLSLANLVDVEAQIKLACDCLVASIECSIIFKIHSSLKPLEYTMTDVLTCRKTHSGTVDESVKWIKVNIPRHRVRLKKEIPLNKQEEKKLHNEKGTEFSNSKTEKVRDTTAHGSKKQTGTDDITLNTPGNVYGESNKSEILIENRLEGLTQPKNKPLPPENLIEGTNEDHMQASLIAMKNMPVRGPPKSPLANQADRIYRTVWDTKDISEDTILKEQASCRSPLSSSGIDVRTASSKLSYTLPSQLGTSPPFDSKYGPKSLPVGEVYGFSEEPTKHSQTLDTHQEVSFEDVNNDDPKLKPVASTLSSTYSASRYSQPSSQNVLSGKAAGVSDLYGTLTSTAAYARERLHNKTNNRGGKYDGSQSTIPKNSKTLPHSTNLTKTALPRSKRREEQQPLEQPTSLPVLRAGSPPSWHCKFCTTENSNDIAICNVCHKSKSVPEETTGTSGAWVCVSCTYKNKLSVKKCCICGTQRTYEQHIKAGKRDTAV